MKPPVDLRPHRRRRAGGQRWHEHNSARRTAILAAAIALVEELGPTADISTQQIAERAGLARSVIYRQFDHREDLDNHAREFVFEHYLAEFESVLVLDPGKTAEEIIFEVMSTVVRWTTEHTNLYRFGQLGPLPGQSADSLCTFRERIADTLWERFTTVTTILGIDAEPFHPLVHGLVGLVEGVVAQHLSRSSRPDHDTIARLLTSSTWFLLDGHARELGYTFDRTATVGVLLGELLSTASDRTAES